jgi:hypothetical protein
MGIPPGQFVPLDKQDRPSRWREVSLEQKKNVSATDNDNRFTFVAYKYGGVAYPSFHTAGKFDGKVLFESNAGLAAGVRKYGSGDVLFVNLPLSYLVSRTDGLLMHSFLRYFALHMLNLPHLASVPDGVGGLVLNWHIDDKRALKFLEILRNAGVFDHGPFSIHLTAGPDVDGFHDGKGLDLNNNPEAQRWVQFFLRQGDEVGSHGGWIHNYFAAKMPDQANAAFENFLLWNKEAVEHASGRKAVEYSAPVGNQPVWVTQWLEQHGFVAYYFAGNGGMGPTRVYRDGERDGAIWAFPILHLGTAASFEELRAERIPDKLVQDWLTGITDFVSQAHAARLFYSHPIGSSIYLGALTAWMDYTSALAQQGKFRWYTMTALANFLTARESVRWTIADAGNNFFLDASHPKSLNHETWVLPRGQYGALHVTRGKAEIRAVDDNWFITAGDCTRLQIRMDDSHPAGRQTPRS